MCLSVRVREGCRASPGRPEEALHHALHRVGCRRANSPGGTQRAWWAAWSAANVHRDLYATYQGGTGTGTGYA